MPDLAGASSQTDHDFRSFISDRRADLQIDFTGVEPDLPKAYIIAKVNNQPGPWRLTMEDFLFHRLAS